MLKEGTLQEKYDSLTEKDYALYLKSSQEVMLMSDIQRSFYLDKVGPISEVILTMAARGYDKLKDNKGKLNG